MTVIALTTDLGASFPAAGQIHGVIWSHAPAAKIVDLTHEIPVRDRISAQVVLENALPYFPEGTIHLVVISPSAEEAPRPIVARLGSMLFVGPDNGLITPLIEHAEVNRWPVEAFHANNLKYWLPAGGSPVLAIYASLAGHLAAGVPPAALGERINDPLRANIPAPEMIGDGWRGQIVQIDHFGNLAANIKRAHLEGIGPVQVRINGIAIEGLARTFGEGKHGDLIAMIDSSNHLSICVVNGNAAERLNAHTGDVVEVQPRHAI